MDAFAVSIAAGITVRNIRVAYAVKIALFFGFFQAIMPVAGWYSGRKFSKYVEAYAHWAAFALLAFIGTKMIYEAFQLENIEEKSDYTGFKALIFLSIATSIDAFAVGVSFAFLSISIVLPVIIIGIITFMFSFAGIYIGDQIGNFFERKIEIFGGLILIGIGLKILLENILVV